MTIDMDKIDALIDIQKSDGNWNYSEYMMGMLNGMIMIKSVITGEDPEFYDKSDEWGCDNPIKNESSIKSEEINEKTE